MCRWFVAAALPAILAAAPARADWQVHRADSSALLERAERALLESPDNDQLARRLIQIAGAKGRAGVRERFKSRAQRAAQTGGNAAYAPLAAYARLLLALGDGKAAAAAFSDVLRVAPQSAAALSGRAQAFAAAGDDAAALAAYDEALAKEQRPGPRQRLIEAELAIVARTAKADDRAALEKAVTLRREMARIDPDKDDAATRLADALEHAGRPGKAHRFWRNASSADAPPQGSTWRCARRACGLPPAPRRISRSRLTCSPSWRASFRRATRIDAAQSGHCVRRGA